LLLPGAHATEGIMISVIIPTLNSEETLVKTLAGLIPATVAGVIREVIIADGGSNDRSHDIVEDSGASWISCGRANRGAQLQAGALEARSPWLLFLHADTVLGSDWDREAQALMQQVEMGQRPSCAGVFQFRLDDAGFAPRALEAAVRWRTQLLKFPYGDQGLLIPRALFDDVGGYRPLQLMEDVDLIRRIGRARICVLSSYAKTSAARYRNGYLRRIARNQLCLALYYLNVSPDRLVKLYRSRPAANLTQT